MGCTNTTLDENKKRIEKILFKVTYNNEAYNGFICKIPFFDSKDLLKVLILLKVKIFETLDENEYKNINLKLNDNSTDKSYYLSIKENRIVYNTTYATIIEIKEEDGIDSQ